MAPGEAAGRRFLALGFIAVLVLVMTASAVSVIDARRTRSEVHALVTRAEEALALVGRIGRALAEERNIVLEALTEPASASPHAKASLARIEESLGQDLQSLELRLEPEEREDWLRVRAELAQVRAGLVSALEEIATGAAGAAETRLDLGIGAVTRIHAALDGLARRNELEAEKLFAGTRDRLDRLVIVQVAMATALLVALGVIVASGERLISGYLERIEQSNQDLDAFAGRMAHDVRNVLAPMAAAGEILKRTENPAAVGMVADQILRSTGRAQSLLDGLLAFSRPNARHRGGEAQVVAACENVLDDLEPLIRRIGVLVERRVEPSKVGLERELLHVVLANVIGNAVKFLEGREQRSVRIEGAAIAGTYVFEIEDTGPGIPPEAIGRIFDPFYRAPGSTASGTGIGLATVRRVIDAHAGEITVRSTLGRGTAFRIELPLAQPALMASEPTAVSMRHRPGSGRIPLRRSPRTQTSAGNEVGPGHRRGGSFLRRDRDRH